MGSNVAQAYSESTPLHLFVEMPQDIHLITKFEEKNHYFLLVMVGLILLSGIFYSIYLGDTLRYLPDEADYLALTRNLVTSKFFSLDGSSPTAYRPPGYPLFLSLFYFLGARVVLLRLVNFIILGLSIFVLTRILSEGFSPIAGIIGAALVILYPVVFYAAGIFWPQTLATFLFLLALYLLFRNEHRTLYYLLPGLLLGFLVLTVPLFVFVFPIFGVWSWIYPERLWGRGMVFAFLIVAIVIGTWTLRNYLCFRTSVFVSTNSGENLLLGNSEYTTPNGGSGIDILKYEAQASDLSEVERDRFFRDQALEYILSHKYEALRLYALKFLNYFNYRNELVTKDEASAFRDLLMLITYGPLLLTFLIRLLLSSIFKLSSLEVLLILLYFGSALSSALFFTRIRFRIPFDFLLIMLVAIFIDRVLRGLAQQSQDGSKIRLPSHERWQGHKESC